MITVVRLNTFFLKSEKQGKPFLSSYQVYKNRSKRTCNTNCAKNPKPKQTVQGELGQHNGGFLQENDTSGWDCIHMSPVERFKCAASLQVLYEDLETYKDDIKTYEDWMIILERLTIITQANQKFWKTLVLEHFLPRAEKFIDGGYISQVHWLLQKVSNLDLQINEKYVKSFVLTICRQKVFRYTYAKTSVEMYIDMMSIVGEMLHDGSLVEVNQDENSL
eukprot:TRINITY_DN2164_c0_g1_i1.p1 TRINITY_DN2164_c0_g1~~TRINITY_DN2164_c0_g1_i1.p1  ORF type:complete len:220 (-),score=9.17 TRINITY_DN2164_c0_g1_i1:31-690(-)